MTTFTVGQRVRVINKRLYRHGQIGVIVSKYHSNLYDWYVAFEDGEKSAYWSDELTPLDTDVFNIELTNDDINDIRRAMGLAIIKTNDMAFVDRLTVISGKLPHNTI